MKYMGTGSFACVLGRYRFGTVRFLGVEADVLLKTVIAEPCVEVGESEAFLLTVSSFPGADRLCLAQHHQPTIQSPDGRVPVADRVCDVVQRSAEFVMYASDIVCLRVGLP